MHVITNNGYAYMFVVDGWLYAVNSIGQYTCKGKACYYYSIILHKWIVEAWNSSSSIGIEFGI